MMKKFLLLLLSTSHICFSETKLWPTTEHNFISTSHQIEINGKSLQYTAVLGALPLRSEEAAVQANIFFVAYFKDKEKFESTRPITFVFNGGPGCASIWLHVGGIGPKTIKALENPTDQFSAVLDSNPHTILDETDLVFIDPVGTGFSQLVDEKKAKEFYSVEGDIKVCSEFIAGFLSHFKRWDSPKYLLGESYGTLRCGGMAKYMHTNLGIFLDGIILISPAMNYEIVLPFRDNSIFFATSLPSYAVTAWYHEKISHQEYPKISSLIKEVKEFTSLDYLHALYQGDALAGNEKKDLVAKIAKYTSLSHDCIEKQDLRVSDLFFMDHFFPKETKTVGRMDARTTGYYNDPESVMFELDPAVTKAFGVIVPAFYSYLQTELGFDQEALYYKVVALDINAKWDFSEYILRYPNITSSLRSAFFAHPHLKIFVGSGIYDLAVPFAGAEYIVNHFLLPKPLQANCSLRYYNAGHMMYLDTRSSAKLKKDLVKFYRNPHGENDNYEILD